MKDIAIKGKFSLRYKTYLSNYEPNAKDICIVKWQYSTVNGTKKLTCYTIADFNADGELVSCGDRLLDAIGDIEDLDNIKALADIGAMIINGDDKVDLGE